METRGPKALFARSLHQRGRKPSHVVFCSGMFEDAGPKALFARSLHQRAGSARTRARSGGSAAGQFRSQLQRDCATAHVVFCGENLLTQFDHARYGCASNANGNLSGVRWLTPQPSTLMWGVGGYAPNRCISVCECLDSPPGWPEGAGYQSPRRRGRVQRRARSPPFGGVDP